MNPLPYFPTPSSFFQFIQPIPRIGQMALSEALLLHYNCLTRILMLVSQKDSTIVMAHATRHSPTWRAATLGLALRLPPEDDNLSSHKARDDE